MTQVSWAIPTIHPDEKRAGMIKTNLPCPDQGSIGRASIILHPIIDFARYNFEDCLSTHSERSNRDANK
jgi:hypothetical protein